MLLLFGWIFSFESIFKLFFTLLSASVSLSLLFERENTQRKLEIMYERIEVLQHHVMVIRTLLRLLQQFTNYNVVLAVESGCTYCRRT